MSFGGTSSFGNLMTPPSFAPAQGAAQAPGDFSRFFNLLRSSRPSMNGNPMTQPSSQPMQPPPAAGMPQASQPMPSFQPPQMTGNLMPVPQFAPAQDYVAPPPAPPAPPAPGTVGPNGSYVDEYGRWITQGDPDYGYSFGNSRGDGND
jgi:hypothetical protein